MSIDSTTTPSHGSRAGVIATLASTHRHAARAVRRGLFRLIRTVELYRILRSLDDEAREQFNAEFMQAARDDVRTWRSATSVAERRVAGIGRSSSRTRDNRVPQGTNP